MVTKNAIGVLAGVLVGALALSGCGAQEDKSGATKDAEPAVVLAGIGGLSQDESQGFVDQVAQLSDGSMSVAMDPNWRVGSVTGEAELIDSIRSGSADLAVVPARAWHGAGVDSFDALIAPMAIDSYQLQDAVLHDGVVDDMLDGVQPFGLTGIGILPGPIRRPAGMTRELLAIDNFQGATIAISPGAVADRSIRALGATPVASLFNGADMSPFDGAELQISAVEGNEYDGAVTSVSGNVGFWPRPLVIVGNAKSMAALTDSQRQILNTAAKQAVTGSTERNRATDSEAVRALCSREKLRFITSTDAQQQALRRAFAPIIAWLSEDAKTKTALQRIDELRAGIDTAADPVPECLDQPASTATSAPVVTATPIDGVYEMTSTADEAAALGMPVDAAAPANLGKYTWMFSGGKFTESQAYESTQTWANGTYVVDGDTLTMTYLDGGGSGPASEAHQHGGFVAAWKWSSYHDQLTITWPDPSLGPTEYPANYTVNPWTRIGDAPGTLAPQTDATTG